MTGLLRVTGQIDVGQFWPDGSSDADTTKIKIIVDAGSFAFAEDRQNFVATNVYDDAYSKGASRKKLIDSQNRITVRLQGIDAPELHYSAGPLQKNRPEVTPEKRAAYNAANREDRRQFLAESATVALAEKLRGVGAGLVDCIMYSLIDRPNEVVDTYGRFVGNIRVGDSFATDINIWLAEQGWCYPTFYSSMEKEEIDALLAAMKKAGKKNCWKFYSKDTTKFDPDVIYRKPPAAVDAANDRGPVLMPKVFRRQVAYEMEKAAKIFKGPFKKFLQAKPDYCFTLKDFLVSGPNAATPRQFDEFQLGTKFSISPHEVVFREKYSDVVDANGNPITSF